MSWLKKIFGDPNARAIAKLKPFVAQINSLESQFTALTDTELKEKTIEFRQRLADGATLEDLLPEAFATVREAARRTLGQRHFDVQLLGGIVLHWGNIAEMRTGEGKTLTATLPVYLHALAGKGAHVVTVNDYLACRDAAWMGQIYHALGLTVGIIQQQNTSFFYDPNFKVAQKITAEGLTDQETAEDKERDQTGAWRVAVDFLRPCERAAAYRADITYGTNNEFGFDYLRDNMVADLSEMAQRPLYYAIVDEVDSILIDEARTPLIISAPAEEAGDTYYKFADLVLELQEKEHYTIDEKQRSVSLNDVGIAKVEQILDIENLYVAGGHKLVHHLESALRAKAMFKLDRDYVVKNGEVIIVDEFTGRLMFGRRYSEGLHQAIEAKEQVPIQRESQTLATITFQNYFRLYERLAGMTGTAVTEAEEFFKIYKLEVVVIPPNKGSRRVDLPDRIYRTEEGKLRAVAEEVKARHAAGQPVLIGTISIEKNEQLSLFLERAGVPHEILNAKNHAREGEIIAQAGRRGHVTLATNMAGRGVDIILGGNPPDVTEADAVKAAGGLFVLGTERHESRRIDNQLRGRSGRQGDVGETLFCVSCEDDLMRVFGTDRMKNMLGRLNVPDDMPIEHSLISKSIETAQHKVEGHNFDIRKHLLEYDDVLNRHREVVYKKRRELLELSSAPDALEQILQNIGDMFEQEIEQLVYQYSEVADSTADALDELQKHLERLLQVDASTIIKCLEPLNTPAKQEAHEMRTAVIEPLARIARAQLRAVVSKIPPALGVAALRGLSLRAIDALWIEHLEAINYLRTGIGLRGYAQQDPLVEYKRDTYRLFQELLAYIQKDIVYGVLSADQSFSFSPSLLAREGIVLSGADDAVPGGKKVIAAKDSVTPVGRNDLCPCGSGKKYKKCHGA